MSKRWGIVGVLLAVILAACGGSPGQPEELTRAEALWTARTPYIGNNSRVAALVRHVGPASETSYHLSLQTTTRPYELTIELDRVDKPFEDTDFSESATLMLGLVGNLDKVSVTAPDNHRYSLTSAGASANLGYDVKALGRDRGRLEKYLDAHAS